MLPLETSVREVARKTPIRDSKRIGKVQLCEELGWTRPKLDRRLDSDPRFPVVYRGGEGHGRSWGFDLDAVLAYLANHPESETATAAMPDSAPGRAPSTAYRARSDDFDVPDEDGFDVTPVHHAGEETAKQRLVTAQASIQEDKLRKSRGELVQIEDLRTSLSTLLMHLTKGLDSLPERIVQHLNLPAEQTLTIRELINQLRVSLVADIGQVLTPHA